MRCLLFLFILFNLIPGYCEFNIKQGALASVERFFNIRDQKWVMDGMFVDTDAAYGESCQIIIDLSKSGDHILALRGEYDPKNTVGEGINFKAGPDTFMELESAPSRLLIKQAMADSFSTGVETAALLTKEGRILRMKVEIQSTFLFIPSNVSKTCQVNDFITYR